MKKGSVDNFMWVRFHEHPVVDYSKQASKLFDVTAEGHPDFLPDFGLIDGFDHCQYCMCLIETAFGLPTKQLTSFIDYQCCHIKEPYRWLIQFDTLLNSNCQHPLIEPFRQKLNLLIQVLEEKRNEYAAYVLERKQLIFERSNLKNKDERFDIVKVKKELEDKSTYNTKRFFLMRRKVDYLQEVENDSNASFVKNIDMEIEFLEAMVDVNLKESEIKKISFKGNGSQLADLISQLKDFKNQEGDLFFDGSIVTYTRMICTYFHQSDGTSFKESSIRKYLTNYSVGTRPRKKDQIDISNIQIPEE